MKLKFIFLVFIIQIKVFSLENNSAPVEAQYFWPAGKIYYKIDYKFYKDSDISLIKQAMQNIMNVSKVKFVEINNTELENQKNYINITDGDSCHSEIGMIGGAQKLLLHNMQCMRLGTIMHELMHSIGFYHEQSRYDRDQYIIINWDNIIDKRKYNFEKKGEFTTRFGKYDYASIMHYGAYAFSKNGSCTISTVDPQINIGQRSQLSPTDIYGLWLAYGTP
ncbi:M12 family metallopeptidase [Pigmentibacter sp. JX0631]|uniref:M12 family metallopeptidase n=1 Tax=Pigmentibacter sp. JX0631 TaxID=2976982 RepID=UPI002468966E|nr:M12 family metallopeptidase [Pigmentibacter sp. JX0631]WGL61185.1 M12 family metallopeptidase [Pigmentibacter sp. JX0631]